MYHVECIDIHKGDEMFAYADRACLCANNMYNVANFHIRNLMTGLKKPPSERTRNERDVISAVEAAVPAANASLMEKRARRIKKISSNKDLSPAEKQARIGAVRTMQFSVPDAEKWFPSYGLLDAVFRQTGDPDYASFHSHVMQNAVKDCCEAWKGYFEGLRAYSPQSGHTGRPRIPGYRRSGGRSTAVFSNTACIVKHGQLVFPYSSAGTPSGKKRSRHSLPVSGLPHASKDRLIEVRVVPYFGSYQVQAVTDDGVDEKDILPDMTGVIGDDGAACGVMTLDPGLTNLAALADNRGGVPIVIKGGAVKARNQWFNKRMAFLRSEQMKGHDPKTYRPPVTKRMRALSRKRDAFLRDTFYKYAHFICRTMEKRGLTCLIVGHNPGQKQGVRMGRVNSQSFVHVPFDRFRRTLSSVSRQYGIRVVLQEESYTSKACFGSRDRIPVYGEPGSESAAFTGRRTKRGLYVQDDGRAMNADINGSANIGRKHDERLFPEGMDDSYLYGTVKAVTHADILREGRLFRKTKAGAAAPA